MEPLEPDGMDLWKATFSTTQRFSGSMLIFQGVCVRKSLFPLPGLFPWGVLVRGDTYTSTGKATGFYIESY